jgi:hypothetical protein
MIKRKLHTNSKIFFPNPKVMRVQYSDLTLVESSASNYRKLTRQAYKLIRGTWGYSELRCETLRGSNHLPDSIDSLFDDYGSCIRGYICFEDEMDLLQFKLMTTAEMTQVSMWPAQTFLIHEVIHD